MTQRAAVLDTYQEAPEWMQLYVRQLAAVTRHDRPLRVLVAPQEFFDTMPKSLGGASGACMMLQDGTDVIILPESAQPTEFWLDVLAHGFAHSLHSPIDRASLTAQGIDASEYEKLVEKHVVVLGGLIQFAAQYGTPRKT